jgi:hypothetical protein
VDDAGRVGLGEAVGRLGSDLEQAPRRKRPALLGEQDLAQRLPVDQLHHDVGQARGLADLVDRDDVRVVERRGGPCLLGEAAEPGGVGGEALGQELHGHFAEQVVVARAPDVAHAPRADARDQLEAREPHADGGRQWGSWAIFQRDGSARDYAPPRARVKTAGDGYA